MSQGLGQHEQARHRQRAAREREARGDESQVRPACPSFGILQRGSAAVVQRPRVFPPGYHVLALGRRREERQRFILFVCKGGRYPCSQ